MSIRAITTRPAITLILILQLLPLILFPPASYATTSQEWWLPMLLMIFSVVALVQIIWLHSESSGPWDLIGFTHGFNIISRLMLLMPHATMNANGQQFFNTLYVILTVLSMAASGAILWYIGQPAVRSGMLRD